MPKSFVSELREELSEPVDECIGLISPAENGPADCFREADLPLLACEQGRQRRHLVCRRKSEQILSKDQVEGFRFKRSLPHEQRTSNTGTNVPSVRR